ncbi:hypothetical protein M0R72_15020 [Candidatus Pacearchaeota archaeon]|jgi:hypothetical protein|nr:hypothetical protein [Candidatus Pacearchaeota archaeon]
MGYAIPQILLICCLIAPSLAEDFNPEEDDTTSLAILDDKPPITDPVHMPEAAQIIVESAEDLYDLDYTGINWTEFYKDFQPLEANLTA